VNFGGAWGGRWYFSGAILEFVRGRAGTDESGDMRVGLKWVRRDVRRPPNRADARMAEMQRKRRSAARETLGRREFARV
jgi:hypothetical protein